MTDPVVDAGPAVATPLDAYRVKGATGRVHLEYLQKIGLLEAVLPYLSPEAVQLIANRPLPGSWVAGRLLDEFTIAVFALKGKEGVLTMERSVIGGPLNKM